jgi:hypothetical protein
MTLDQQLQLDWWDMYRRCFVREWSWGVLQPEYVYMEQPLVIIDDM